MGLEEGKDGCRGVGWDSMTEGMEFTFATNKKVMEDVVKMEDEV